AFCRHLKQRQPNCLADVGEQLVSCLCTLARVRTVVELHRANNREVGSAAHQEIDVLCGNTIERALPRGCAQTRLDRSEIGNANLAKNAMLWPYGLIEYAEERALGGREQRLCRDIRETDLGAGTSLLACDSRESDHREHNNNQNQNPRHATYSPVAT